MLRIAICGPGTLLLSAVACALLPSAACAQEGEITIEGYKQLILQQRAQVESLLVSYESKLSYDQAVRDSGRLAGIGLASQDTVAFSGAKRYAKSANSGMNISGDEFEMDRTSVFDGRENRIQDPKTLHIQQPKSGYSELNAYLNGLLWPVTDGELEHSLANPAEADFLPYFLEAPGWSVLPRRETIDGVSCVVLSLPDAARKLWLDPAHGYALMRYEHRQPVAGVSQWTNRYFDHREVLPGLWLPMRTTAAHDLVDRQTGAPIGRMEIALSVTRLELNNVPDSLFVLEPRPGDTVVDSIRDTIYEYRPATDKLLEETLHAMASTPRIVREPHPLRNIFLAFNAAAALVVVAALLARWRTKRKPAAP